MPHRIAGRFVVNHWKALLVTVLILGYPTWLLFDRSSPVVRLDGSAYPLVAAPGEEVQIIWNVTSDETCVGTSRKEIVDAEGTHWDLGTSAAIAKKTDDGKQYPIIRGFKLPDRIAEGLARYHSDLTFYCNFMHYLWPIHERTRDVVFEVNKNTHKTPILPLPPVIQVPTQLPKPDVVKPEVKPTEKPVVHRRHHSRGRVHYHYRRF